MPRNSTIGFPFFRDTGPIDLEEVEKRVFSQEFMEMIISPNTIVDFLNMDNELVDSYCGLGKMPRRSVREILEATGELQDEIYKMVLKKGKDIFVYTASCPDETLRDSVRQGYYLDRDAIEQEVFEE